MLYHLSSIPFLLEQHARGVKLISIARKQQEAVKLF